MWKATFGSEMSRVKDPIARIQTQIERGLREYQAQGFTGSVDLRHVHASDQHMDEAIARVTKDVPGTDGLFYFELDECNQRVYSIGKGPYGLMKSPHAPASSSPF